MDKACVVYIKRDDLEKLLSEAGYDVYADINEVPDNRLTDIEFIIGRPNKKKLNMCTKLKWLQILSSGTNGYENKTLYANPNSIMLTNAAGVFSIPMAEYCVGAMILLLKKSLSNNLCVWPYCKRLRISEAEDLELSSATIAVFGGSGSVGTEIVRRVYGVGCRKIICVSRSGATPFEYAEGVRLCDADNAIPECDVIVSVMPENSESVGYWDNNKFTLMKKSCVFINVGRGSAVVQKDLVRALKTKKISGAVLDVSTPDPMPKLSLLRLTRRLVITNHSSNYSRNNQERIEALIKTNIENYLSNRPLMNISRIN